MKGISIFKMKIFIVKNFQIKTPCSKISLMLSLKREKEIMKESRQEGKPNRQAVFIGSGRGFSDL